MRVFVDTNVLVSAALFPSGVAAAAWEKAVYEPNDLIVSDYVIDELRRVFARKFPYSQIRLNALVRHNGSTRAKLDKYTVASIHHSLNLGYCMKM